MLASHWLGGPRLPGENASTKGPNNGSTKLEGETSIWPLGGPDAMGPTAKRISLLAGVIDTDDQGKWDIEDHGYTD